MLREQIDAALRDAMKSQDELRRSVFRMLISSMHNREIEKRTKSASAHDESLTDEEIMQVIRSEAKKRKDAIDAYTQGGRQDAAERERAEANVLAALLPPELSDEELSKLVDQGIASTGATSVKEFGKVMGWVMGRVRGQAFGERISTIIRTRLGAS